MRKPNLALFDFDGTISNRDSFLLFVRKTVGVGRFCAGMAQLSPRIGRFLLKCYPNHDLKEDVLARFFKGCPVPEFRKAAETFCLGTVPFILRRQAESRLRWHQERGDRVAVVSATPELILAPWCHQHELDLLATRLQVTDGKLSGRIEG
ncbi:MAG TPA: HAD-IB family hydrolase, partial [Desulfobulbus sp.]|nr:HAD-IB family hydrolase [Desulfobulbus sp.]